MSVSGKRPLGLVVNDPVRVALDDGAITDGATVELKELTSAAPDSVEAPSEMI